MKDLNKIMPKIPGLRWGAITNKFPTNQRVAEMNKLFPHDGKWHEVYYENDFNYIDGKRIPVQNKERWT